MNDENVVVQVKSATQVDAYLPFTALPNRYKGKKVELVIVPDGMKLTEEWKDAELTD